MGIHEIGGKREIHADKSATCPTRLLPTMTYLHPKVRNGYNENAEDERANLDTFNLKCGEDYNPEKKKSSSANVTREKKNIFWNSFLNLIAHICVEETPILKKNVCLTKNLAR